MNELKYWLAFNSIEGLGSVSIMKIWGHFKSIKEAWFASAADLYAIEDISSSIIEKIIANRRKTNPDELQEEVLTSNIKTLCILDSDYPNLLKQIYNPPVILYYKGNIECCNFNRTVALVGTRKPSDYGREMAHKLGKEFAKYGITIVSGLAEGIDTCAHTACLEANGKTIAVLGSGINVVYPKVNKNLYKQIIENNNGVVFSEYLPDTQPESWRFPYRNRIISGLSFATIVVEARSKGGGIITAHNALEQNREVFGVASRVDNDLNDGVHNLIYKGEAKIFTSYKRFFEVLNWEIINLEEPDCSSINLDLQEKIIVDKTNYNECGNDDTSSIDAQFIQNNATTEDVFATNTDDKENIVLNYLGKEPTAFDIILQKTNFETSSLLSILTMLELKGLITQASGKRYIRVI